MKTKIFFPRIWQSILVIAMGVGFQLVAGLILGIVFIAARTSQTDLLIATLVASPVCTFLAAWFGVYMSKIPIKSYIQNRLDSKIKILLCFFFFLGVYFVVLFLGGILETFLPVDDTLNTVFTQGFNSWLGIAAIVVLAPIFEELLFRGVILRGFIKNYGTTKALIITSLLFGLFHMNPIQFITASLLGFALGWIFIKTGSLWVCMLFHALNNGISTLLYHITSNSILGDIALLIIMIAAIVLGSISAVLLVKKPDNISFILSERDEALKQRAAFENQQAQIRMAAMQYNPYYPQYHAQSQNYTQSQDYTPTSLNSGANGYNMGQNYMYQQGYMMAPPPPSRQSGLGIASFVISLVVGISELVLFISVVSAAAISHAKAYDTAIIYVAVAILGSLANLAGIGLGAAGAARKDRKKAFSILGIVINSVVLLLFILLVVIGIVMSRSLPLKNFPF